MLRRVPVFLRLALVFAITAGSEAWKPQATLAELIWGRMSSSSPMTYAPKLSPRSQFKSIFFIKSSFFERLTEGQPFKETFFTSVISICPGAWVITNGGLEAITALWGVTPQAQNTGTSPG